MKRKMNPKSNLTCSICSLIFNEPISLPCKDTICAHHLNDSKVLEQDHIKCVECGQKFSAKLFPSFTSNKSMQKMLDNYKYLSNDEKTTRDQIESSLRELYLIHEEFLQNTLECGFHFEEIKFKIEFHRKKLNEQIDDIALEMTEKVKIVEAEYLERLNTNLENMTKSFDEEMRHLNEKFREPDLTLNQIKRMQKDQEDTLLKIKVKLNETTQVNDHLILNQFEPRFSFDSNSFGVLNLVSFWNEKDSFQSSILTKSQSKDLSSLFSPNDTFSLLYRASRDGFRASDFHSRCDGKSSTLTIFKVKTNGFLFGAYTSVSWDSSSKYKSDPHAFIFSLINGDNTRCLLNVNPKRKDYSIFCSPSNGPSFGFGDICIRNNANIKYSSSNLNCTYKHPMYMCGTIQAKSFLAGSFEFLLSEIEVYQKYD